MKGCLNVGVLLLIVKPADCVFKQPLGDFGE